MARLNASSPYAVPSVSSGSNSLYSSTPPMECAECGALIAASALARHHLWHEELTRPRPIRYIRAES